MKKIFKGKTHIAFSAILIAALILSGCSSNEQPSETERENPSLKEAFKNSEGVSQEQFESDINQSEKIQFCHSSDYVYESPYIINEYEIIKRQTNVNEKTDILYATLDLSNEYFDATVDAEFEYEYYDVGGWILEDTKLTVNDVIPTRVPEGELAVAQLNGKTIYYTLEGYPEYEGYMWDLYFNSASFNPITCVSGQYECCLNVQYETEYVVGTAMATMIFKNHKWFFNTDEDNYEKRLITVLSCQEKTDGFFESLSGEYFLDDGYWGRKTLYIDIDYSDESAIARCICNSHKVTRYEFVTEKEEYYTSIIDPIELRVLSDIGANSYAGGYFFNVSEKKIGSYEKVN